MESSPDDSDPAPPALSSRQLRLFSVVEHDCFLSGDPGVPDEVVYVVQYPVLGSAVELGLNGGTIEG